MSRFWCLLLASLARIFLSEFVDPMVSLSHVAMDVEKWLCFSLPC